MKYVFSEHRKMNKILKILSEKESILKYFKKTREDFKELLFALAQWKNEQKTLIKGVDIEKRRFILKEIVTKEVSILRVIDQLRNESHNRNSSRMIANSLLSNEKPFTLLLSKGTSISVKTPHTLKVARLNKIYHELASLSHANVSKDRRLHILEKINNLANDDGKGINPELINLIDREIGFLRRNFCTKNHGGLRLRILKLFLDFVQNRGQVM